MSLYRRGKTWWFSFQFAGQKICESAKTTSKVVARDAEHSRRRELEETWNRIEKRTMPPNFSKAAQGWLDKVTVCPATKRTYTFALEHVKRYFGGMLVCDISAADIAAYQERRTSAGAGAATVNKEIVCLGSILRVCGVWHRIKKSKNDVRLLEEPESKGRALDSEEEQKLLAAAAAVGAGEHHQGHWSPVYTVTAVALNTGMRHSEVRSLRWNQVDLMRRMLIVGKSKTAAGTGRVVPLSPPAWAALDTWASRFPERKPEQYVFPACENGKMDTARPISNWRTAWERATEKAGLAGLGFHSLRHSAATKLLENGVPFAVVAQILGWSASTAVRMAKRYGHIRPEVQRAALDGIATQDFSATTYSFHYNREAVLESEVAN